jgi:hypothetical protein
MMLLSLSVYERIPDGHPAMFDEFLTLAFQHYVVFGILAVVGGILLNLALTVAPEIMQALHRHKLY